MEGLLAHSYAPFAHYILYCHGVKLSSFFYPQFTILYYSIDGITDFVFTQMPGGRKNNVFIGRPPEMKSRVSSGSARESGFALLVI